MSNQSAPVSHIWHRCHGCGAAPIIGRRFDCQSCPAGPDRHLCDRCFAEYRAGQLEHPPRDSYAAGWNVVSHTFIEAFEGATAGAASWSAVPDAHAAAPTIPTGFVVRPEFVGGAELFWGSYASVVEPADGAGVIVVTALHVLDQVARAFQLDLGEPGAAGAQEELARRIGRVNCYDVFAEKWPLAAVGSAGVLLLLPSARLGEAEPCCQRDFAAFRALASDRWSPGRLAAAPPAAGEPVWLAVSRRPETLCRTLPATVVEESGETFICRFMEGDTRAPRHTSGAPFVNASGELVAINVGTGRLNGRRYAHGVHVASVRAHLAMAWSTG